MVRTQWGFNRTRFFTWTTILFAICQIGVCATGFANNSLIQSILDSFEVGPASKTIALLDEFSPPRGDTDGMIDHTNQLIKAFNQRHHTAIDIMQVAKFAEKVIELDLAPLLDPSNTSAENGLPFLASIKAKDDQSYAHQCINLGGIESLTGALFALNQNPVLKNLIFVLLSDGTKCIKTGMKVKNAAPQ